MEAAADAAAAGDDGDGCDDRGRRSRWTTGAGRRPVVACCAVTTPRGCRALPAAGTETAGSHSCATHRRRRRSPSEPADRSSP